MVHKRNTAAKKQRNATMNAEQAGGLTDFERTLKTKLNGGNTVSKPKPKKQSASKDEISEVLKSKLALDEPTTSSNAKPTSKFAWFRSKLNDFVQSNLMRCEIKIATLKRMVSSGASYSADKLFHIENGSTMESYALSSRLQSETIFEEMKADLLPGIQDEAKRNQAVKYAKQLWVAWCAREDKNIAEFWNGISVLNKEWVKMRESTPDKQKFKSQTAITLEKMCSTIRKFYAEFTATVSDTADNLVKKVEELDNDQSAGLVAFGKLMDTYEVNMRNDRKEIRREYEALFALSSEHNMNLTGLRPPTRKVEKWRFDSMSRCVLAPITDETKRERAVKLLDEYWEEYRKGEAECDAKANRQPRPRGPLTMAKKEQIIKDAENYSLEYTNMSVRAARNFEAKMKKMLDE